MSTCFYLPVLGQFGLALGTACKLRCWMLRYLSYFVFRVYTGEKKDILMYTNKNLALDGLVLIILVKSLYLCFMWFCKAHQRQVTCSIHVEWGLQWEISVVSVPCSVSPAQENGCLVALPSNRGFPGLDHILFGILSGGRRESRKQSACVAASWLSLQPGLLC